MYILVTKDFYDLKCKVDRTAGVALDVQNEARAKEIIGAGFARVLDVVPVGFDEMEAEAEEEEEKDVKADEPKKTNGKGKSKK